ncbi:hypothetical protein BET03_05925 [Thermohalobacter berrensis]|uniref:Shikimate kinase n=2 Tax=Thermohalobacter berrensis TaxID=99594 RepID=A0A419SV30_9FIRM|nr:hypothetical protein BET03_05925 [Thermohalobacter berrensis]
MLIKEGNAVYHITLTCESSVLKKRIKMRNTQKLVSIKRALECNNQIKKLESHYSINTTQKSPEQVADIVCEIVDELINRSGKNND